MVLFTLVLALAFLQPVKVSAYVLPKDLPTIEALIALHKAVKKDEDQALQRVATSFGEQSLLTKGAVKFNDVRTTLDTKLSNAHSYLVPYPPLPTRCTNWSGTTRTLHPIRSATYPRNHSWHGTMRMPT